MFSGGQRVAIGVMLTMLVCGGRGWSQDPAAPAQQPQTPGQTPAQTPQQTPQAPADPQKPGTAPATTPPATAPAAPAAPTDATAAGTPAAGAPAAPADATAPAAAPAGDMTAPGAATPAAATAEQAPATDQNAQPQAGQTGPPAPKTAAAPQAKKGKQPYTGPTTVVELPPTPMLDGEGKQRLDPDGKPMFNPPVKQQRDKLGHPLFDAEGKPVFQTASDLGYDAQGHKIHEKKEKPPKTISVSISRGTLTVDGMIGKAALNYDISDLKYIYLYAPWIGTVVVSNVPFPGASMQAKAFDQHTLKVTVEDHTFEVYSDKLLLGKNPEPAYVLVDRDFKLPSKVPEMGYGATLKAPYTWPGAKDNPESKAYVKPPPVPVNLRPTKLLPPCPPGQMRAGAGPVLPGEGAPPPPCVPIVAGRPAAVAPAPATAAPATEVQPPAPATAPPPPQ